MNICKESLTLHHHYEVAREEVLVTLEELLREQSTLGHQANHFPKN